MIEEESRRSPYGVRLKLHTFGLGAILQSLPRLFYANGFFSGGCLSAKTIHSDMTCIACAGRRGPLCFPQTFTGVLMKSRLLSSTPQWRRMSYAVVQWK
jgi:hypothetical protein